MGDGSGAEAKVRYWNLGDRRSLVVLHLEIALMVHVHQIALGWGISIED